MNHYVVINFYKFVPLNNIESLKAPLLAKMAELCIKGTLILANEGINGSYSGTQEAVDAFTAYLRTHEALSDITLKINYSDTNPFAKSKVKLRKEIVSLGVDDIDAVNDTGIHVEPAEWNHLISDENVVVIDTRNDYEVVLGTFKNAINPKTINFRDFPDYVEKELINKKDKKIAMFCTGGIRCEKSTAYLKKLGFDEVYQLNGGILNYLDTLPPENSLWEGDCFVFDNRVAIDKHCQAVEPGSIDLEWKNNFKHQDANH